MFERASSISPDSLQIYSALALVYELQQEYEKAVKVYEEMFHLAPQDMKILGNYLKLFETFYQ